MGCVIVDDEVQVEPRRGLTIYLAQEFEELFMAMAIETFSDNGSLKHVERCEKRRRAVANTVVSHGSATLTRANHRITRGSPPFRGGSRVAGLGLPSKGRHGQAWRKGFGPNRAKEAVCAKFGSDGLKLHSAVVKCAARCVFDQASNHQRVGDWTPDSIRTASYAPLARISSYGHETHVSAIKNHEYR
jgi:hypothetical protein